MMDYDKLIEVCDKDSLCGENGEVYFNMESMFQAAAMDAKKRGATVCLDYLRDKRIAVLWERHGTGREYIAGTLAGRVEDGRSYYELILSCYSQSNEIREYGELRHATFYPTDGEGYGHYVDMVEVSQVFNFIREKG